MHDDIKFVVIWCLIHKDWLNDYLIAELIVALASSAAATSSVNWKFITQKSQKSESYNKNSWNMR